ncbi:hypothetical protein C8Q79DRAFT_1012812 [Trametes meyenii]|nr:hypothetical protein C8Q79DRAFT_1012812 [Trametes meyenii]
MLAFRRGMITCLDTAILLVLNASGYLVPKAKCKRTFEQHLADLKEQDKELANIEADIEETLAEAQSLLDAQETLLSLARRLRRLKILHMVVRTAAITTLPFAPVLSAALTAADTLGFAVYIGLYESVVTEDTLRTTSGKAKSYLKVLEEKMAKVRGMRHKLSARRERIEKQWKEPATRRLLDLLWKLHRVRDLVGTIFGSLDGQTGADLSEALMWDLVSAMRHLVAALGMPEEMVTSINSPECESLAGVIVAFRVSIAASASA